MKKKYDFSLLQNADEKTLEDIAERYPAMNQQELDRLLKRAEQKYQAYQNAQNFIPADEESGEAKLIKHTGWYQTTFAAVACLAVTVCAVSGIANMKRRVPPAEELPAAEAVSTSETTASSAPETMTETSETTSGTTKASAETHSVTQTPTTIFSETTAVSNSETADTTEKISSTARVQTFTETVRTEAVLPETVPSVISHSSDPEPEITETISAASSVPEITETEPIPEETAPQTEEFQLPGFRIVYDEYIEKYLFSLDIPAHKQIEPLAERYAPVQLPEGYALFEDNCNYDLETSRYLRYHKDMQKAVTFHQTAIAEARLDEAYSGGFDSVQEMTDRYRPLNINGRSGYIVKDTNGGRGIMSFYTGSDYIPETITVLVWRDEDYVFDLVGEDISEEELIRTAESVQPDA